MRARLQDGPGFSQPAVFIVDALVVRCNRTLLYRALFDANGKWRQTIRLPRQTPPGRAVPQSASEIRRYPRSGMAAGRGLFLWRILV